MDTQPWHLQLPVSLKLVDTHALFSELQRVLHRPYIICHLLTALVCNTFLILPLFPYSL